MGYPNSLETLPFNMGQYQAGWEYQPDIEGRNGGYGSWNNYL